MKLCVNDVFNYDHIVILTGNGLSRTTFRDIDAFETKLRELNKNSSSSERYKNILCNIAIK